MQSYCNFIVLILIWNWTPYEQQKVWWNCLPWLWTVHIFISHFSWSHYSDGIMGAVASQITSLTIVYSTVHAGADQRKHQSSASLAFVHGIHRWPVNSPAQMASNTENISIWWCCHVAKLQDLWWWFFSYRKIYVICSKSCWLAVRTVRRS